MLFQKLRAADKNPVFTLRHIKDLPNPVLAATTKHRQRLARHPPPNGERFTADGPQNDNSAAKSLTAGYSRNTRLHQPPTLLATAADKEREAAAAAAKANGEDGSGEGGGEKSRERDPSAIQPQKEKLDARGQRNPQEADGYAVAIYPYLADGSEEFDVTVGDTFAIMGKVRRGTNKILRTGRWLILRDPEYAHSRKAGGCAIAITARRRPLRSRRSSPAGSRQAACSRRRLRSRDTTARRR